MHLLRRHWLAVLTSTLLLPGTLQAQQLYSDLSSQPLGQIHFNSITPSSRYQLVYRKPAAPLTEIWGNLAFPAVRTGKVPAMVIAHGSAGIQPKDSVRWIPLLNNMGIATFQLDSFTPRHIVRTDDNQALLDQSANDADVLKALQLLATDPRIDASRIGVIGFSRGGVAALGSAEKRFRAGVIGEQDGLVPLRFAAHIAFYPGCGLRYWNRAKPLTGAPIMMALAEKDDYTPIRPCQNFADMIKSTGQEIEVHVYPGAYHDFDNTVNYLRHSSTAETSRNCADREIDPDTWIYHILRIDKYFVDYNQFAAAVGNCVTRGDVTTGNNVAAGKQSELDVQAFLRRVFKL
ncbi:dienelactone hydrolase family protein [Oxalobacteraceae bacterium]|nr:dienelactone hydrolase family protein [Oxalobacteraceae bacterium]